MVLSKRERYIAIGTVAVLGALVFYFVIVGPLFEQKADLATKISAASLKLEKGRNSMSLSASMSRNWNEKIGGPLKSNASDAQGQLLGSVESWAKDAGVTALAINAVDRIDKEKDFSKISVRATCSGGMRQLREFLINIQTATIPVRVTDLQVNTHKEGLDDLSIQLGVSTIYFSPEANKTAAPTAVKADEP